MKRVLGITLMATFLVWSAVAQTNAGAQTTGSAAVNAQAGRTQVSGSTAASNNTSASAGKSGAQANSSTTAAGSAGASHSSEKREASGREKSEPGSSASAAGSLASGSTLQAVLKRPVDSRKNKPGDQVMATTTDNVKSNGRVVIPKHSKLIGHVTEASAKAKGDSSSSLGIVFDKAILRNGQEVPVHAVVQALAASQASLMAQSASQEPMGPMEPMAPAGPAAGGRAVGTGLVGSTAGAATTTVGGVAGGVGQTVGSTTNVAGSAAGSTVGATADAAGNVAGNVGRNGVSAATDASGRLLANSNGVAGLPGLALQSAAASSTQGSVVTSSGKNVHLDSGTQMLLRVVSQ